MPARDVIFGMEVDNNVLYLENWNQLSSVYSSVYLPAFLPFHTVNNEMFRHRFL